MQPERNGLLVQIEIEFNGFYTRPHPFMVEFQITMTVSSGMAGEAGVMQGFLLLSQPPESRKSTESDHCNLLLGLCETERVKRERRCTSIWPSGQTYMGANVGLMSRDFSFPFFPIFHRLFLFLPFLVLPFLFFDL